MDYNFNLKHESQRKFRMHPFLQHPGLERCFSTSSRINVAPCGAGNLAVDPLNFVNFISGLHKKNPTNSHQSLPKKPSMQSSPFSSSAGVSVSCFVSGFVGPDSQSQHAPKYCNGILLDVLLNEIKTFDNTSPNANSTNSNNLSSMKPNVNTKRTYAEVTKEKPKPGKICSMKNICDNFTRLHCCNTGSILTAKEDKSDKTAMDTDNSRSEKSMKVPLRQKSCSSSSDSSVDSDQRKGRTLSECSADSDDSYIVFENDDECVIFDNTEDDASSDCSEEAVDRLTISQEKVPVNSGFSNKKKKQVRFKSDEELVTVHTFDEYELDSRAGPWEQYARDRARFQNRIQGLSKVLTPILCAAHRQQIYTNRFMTT